MSRRGPLVPALIFLLPLCLLSVAEVQSGGAERRQSGDSGGWGLASWLLSRGGGAAAISRSGVAASSGEWSSGVSCWGPGVWPHPAHCSLFSVCRMTGSGVRGVLLRCPDQTAFVTRRWRCYPDKRTNCGKRPIALELLKASMEMRIPRIDLSPRLGHCPFPKPYCSSDIVLTVCAPSHLLIGNVTCPTSCMEDEFGAFCDPEVGQETTTVTKPTTTTVKYSDALPMLDANLMESAIKITSHLGLGPAQKNAGNQTSQKLSGGKKPGVPAHTAPVFDLNGSPEEYSYETDQMDADKPTFSKPSVVVPANVGSTTVSPLPSGNKDSEVFTIEKVQSSVGAVMEQLIPVGMGVTNDGIPSKLVTTEKYVTQGAAGEENAEREKLEREKLEKDKLEREKLEKEKLERERLEKDRLEKEKLEKEKLEREKLEKDRLEKEKLEKEKSEREKLEKEKLEREKLEKDRLEKEKLEKEKLEREKLEKDRLEKEKLEKEKLEREKLEKEKLEREKLEKDRLEKEKLEKEKLEREKLEKDRLEKEKLEKEKLEREKLEKEKLEREKLEKDRLEKEKLEKEKLEREKLEKDRLEKEKLEKEKLEREKLEKEKLERERLEKDRLEKEKLEKEKLERERLEKERLEKEKMDRERLEKEKLEKEKLEKEKLEREKVDREKMEKERLEQEKIQKQKLEKEKIEKEKLEQDRLEKLEMEKFHKEKLEKEQLEIERIENEKKELESKLKEEEKVDALKKENSSRPVLEQSTEASPFSPHDLATVCKRPGLTCVNANVLLECSPDLIPLRAWNCGSFFSRSATLVAKCDREKDSCVAAVDGSYPPEDVGPEGFDYLRPLCKRPGAQCADNATLIHCSEDLRSATVAVCADLFPMMDGGAVCDQTLDACVIGIGDDAHGELHVPTLMTTTEMPNEPIELPFFSEGTTAKLPSAESTVADESLQPLSNQTGIPGTERFPGKPHPSDDPNDTFLALFPMLKDRCRRPGLRCYGGRVLEACERDNPKPVYRMDCRAVLADSVDARCEEQSEGEATCLVALRRNTPLLKSGQLGNTPHKEDDIYILELSVVDVTRTFEYDDSELPPWKCVKVGQYCADESTLLSCSADFSVEFALSCGAIAPQSVVAFCDYTRDACVVKKISDITGGFYGNNSLKDVADQIQNKTNFGSEAVKFNSANQPTEKQKPSFTTQEDSFISSLTGITGQLGSGVGPSKWDFSSISQLYPPDVPLGTYSSQKLKPQTSLDGSNHYLSDSILQSNCTKVGPICLDEIHLGSCSEEMELRYVLPCSALYVTDPAPYCDASLSACLPSASRQTTTTKKPTTTTIPTTKPLVTESPPTTTSATSTKAPIVVSAATTSLPSTFFPQQIPPYPSFNYPTPTGVQFGAQPQISPLQENQFASVPGAHLLLPLAGSNFPLYPLPRPEAYTFFQRPGLSQYSPQQSRPPGFLQTIFQNYGNRFPSFSQTLRPPTLSSFPLLNSIIQGFSTLRPPGVLQQNAEYGLPEVQEPYDYNDPQYQHYAEKYSNAYTPVTYHPILPGSQLIKQVERPMPPLAGGISSEMHSDILKYYTSMLLADKQPVKQPSGDFLGNVYKNRPKPPTAVQSYLDRFLELLQQHIHGQSSLESQSVDFFKSKLPLTSSFVNGGSSLTSSRPAVHKVKTSEITLSSGNPGGVSQVNPLTWLGKLEVPDSDQASLCKRPGMQCVDSDSLGACSMDLKLRYVVPCRNLLPFVSVGKPYCDLRNDACGVLIDEEKSEYPTDFTSYP